MLNIIEYNIDNKFVLFFKLTLKMYTVSLKLVKIDFYFEHTNYILLFYIYYYYHIIFKTVVYWSIDKVYKV